MFSKITNLVANLSIVREICLTISTFRNELLRTALLVAIGLIMLRPDWTTWAMVSYSFGLSFLLVASAHVTRKILFRHLDMEDLTDAALKTGNIAAAIVFAAVQLVLIALMYFMAAVLLK